MSRRFIRILKVVIPMLTVIILASQIAGCSIVSSNEMVDMINAGQTISIELAKPSTYDIVLKGQQQKDKAWVQLDQLKTFNNGFRQDFDTLFNINVVSQNNINGKSGCLFIDESGDRFGNTTLEDALRNKAFVNKYWENPDVKQKLIKLASDIYTDVDGNDDYALMGSLNGYYNLVNDAENPSSFNPTQSLSREQFYTLIFKTEEGVSPIEVDKAFEEAIGGPTANSKFAQGVDEYGFLSVANKSLDATSYKGSISRAEAVYMVVNKYFSSELAKVTGKEKAFKDTKNAGDLALKVGFKYKDKETKEAIGKDRWQAYTLAYMFKNPGKGMEEELYKSMVVAKDLGLITGDESRWDEPISKYEALQLVVNTHLAKNRLYGYLSEAEYGKNTLSKFSISSEDSFPVLGVDNQGLKYGADWVEVPDGIVTSDTNKQLKSGLTLNEVKQKVDKQRELCKQRGYSEKDTNTLLEQLAKDFGTSMDEVNRLPAVAEKPAETSKSRETVVQKPQNNNSASESWDDLPDWQKKTTISPDAAAGGYVPDLTGVPNPFK